MAESTIAGDIGGGIQITCILNEGNPTVTEGGFGTSGTTERATTLPSPCPKDVPVTLDASTSNTYDACLGMPVVKQISASDAIVIGRVVSMPRWVKMPAQSTDADSLTKRLAGQYYRVATVEIWGGITSIFDAKLVTVDAIAVVPGVLTTLTLDASLTIAAGKPVFSDASATGLGWMSFHYAAKAAATTVTILVGAVTLGTAVA